MATKPMIPCSRGTLVLLLACGALCHACAFAQAGEGGRGGRMRGDLQQRFAAADANSDGKLTRDEAQSKMPRVYKNFDAIDTTHAGAVTLQQITAYMATQRSARQRGE